MINTKEQIWGMWARKNVGHDVCTAHDCSQDGSCEAQKKVEEAKAAHQQMLSAQALPENAPPKILLFVVVPRPRCSEIVKTCFKWTSIR